LAIDLLPALVGNYEQWERTHQDASGLFWQIDDRDGMEISIGGSGYRPTINSYMYGDAVALGDMAKWAWKNNLSLDFRMKAARLRALVEDRLWDETRGFYETIPRGDNHQWVDVREEVGYVPWYFNLPLPGHELAWKQLIDDQGFAAPFGPTTAERRSPRFMFANPHECLWNGPSWPFATSQTLTAMANLLNNYKQTYVGRRDYLALLRTYTKSQHMNLPSGRTIPWIDEDLDPFKGNWIARDMLYRMTPEQQAAKGGKDRGRDYNHSTYNDLVITGLVGLRPRLDNRVEVNPLIPEGAIEYFCLDPVRYHGWDLTILYDRTGTRYRRGKGLRIFADGREIGSAPSLGWLLVDLPQTTSGWVKSPANPVIGGKLGTVFDITVLADSGKYKMWGSWRPKKSVALFESADGIHWSEPVVVLSPNPGTAWEEDINRPSVLKKADGYHMWYTGQAGGKHSWIGYATSPDGKVWKRMSEAPVLSPDLPWEKAAVMCPNVLWDEAAGLYRMWYSGGEQYEPDAIGYATSADGLHWTKDPGNPVFRPNPAAVWEQARVTGAQVLRFDSWFYMFYIGFRDIDHAQIGVARSRDGVTNWQRNPRNPIVRPGQDAFDQDACYKPYAVFDGHRWMLWYNGRHGWLEQIALATHEGADPGFGEK
ncbi:MAG: family 43 glycosylhydrolase, partial [Bryobacteraceae bacterium]